MRATGVQVSLGRRTVVDDVDLHAESGEVVALVGPNGAGKSTLLAALAGDVPARGSIEVCGRDVHSYKAIQLARRRAVLPQKVSVSFPFTVAEVVRMGRAPWSGRAESADDEEAVAEALRHTGMTALAARPFPALSGGEQARGALARVLAQRAAILLLDEPTAALDIRHQEQIMRCVRDRADAGATVIVVLHDLGLAAAYADRAYVLADGKVRAAGPPADVFTAALLSNVYRHEVDVFDHPAGGGPLVVPRREGRGG